MGGRAAFSWRKCDSTRSSGSRTVRTYAMPGTCSGCGGGFVVARSFDDEDDDDDDDQDDDDDDDDDEYLVLPLSLLSLPFTKVLPLLPLSSPRGSGAVERSKAPPSLAMKSLRRDASHRSCADAFHVQNGTG